MKTWASNIEISFWKKLFKLAIPISLQSMMLAALGMFDVLMVATLGDAEVAAVGIGGKVFFVNLLTIMGICAAITILGTQYYSSNRINGLRKVIIQATSFNLLITLPFAIFYLIAPSYIVSLSSNDPALIELSGVYLKITGWTILIIAITASLESALHTVSDVKAPTIIGFIAVILNVVLNYILIFGLGPIDPMGVAGSAWATVAGRVLQVILLCCYVYKKHPDLIISIKDFKEATKRSSMIKFFFFVLPLLIKHKGWALGVLVYSLILAHIGTDALAIYSLISPIEGIVVAAFWGFSCACGILLGYELGLNNYTKALYQTWTALYSAVILAIAMGLFIYAFNDHIFQFLVRNEFSSPDTTLQVILVMTLGLGIKVHNMIAINGALKSGGDIKYSAFVDLFGLWVVGVPAAYYAAVVLELSLPLVLLFMLSEELAKFILSFQRMLKKTWLNNLVENTNAP